MFPLGRTLNGTYFAREEECFCVWKITWRPEKDGRETALIDFGWILVVGCPSYYSMLILSIGNAAFDIFRLVVVHVILLSRQPTHIISSCVKECDFQNLCGRCYRVIRCQDIGVTPTAKKTRTLRTVTDPLPLPAEDGNDPWFAVFRLMTKEDLHKAARIGCLVLKHPLGNQHIPP